MTTDNGRTPRRTLIGDIRADLARFGRGTGPMAMLRALVSERTFRLTVSYRIARRLDQRLTGAARVALVPALLVHAMNDSLCGVDLPISADIGPGLRIFHGRGLAISDVTTLGADVSLFGGVTIGRRDQIGDDGARRELGAPIIEDQVWIGPNAVIVGPIRIGRGARVAGGAVVFRDVPARTIVAGNPAKVVRDNAPVDVFAPSGWAS
jgi:serine O-acetyltransferase